MHTFSPRLLGEDDKAPVASSRAKMSSCTGAEME